VIAVLLPLAVGDALLLPAHLVLGVDVGWVMAVHSALTMAALAVWLRRGAAGGFASAMLGVLGPIGLLAALPLGRLSRAGVPRASDELFGRVSPRMARRGARLAVARLLDGRIRHATPETLGSLVTIMRHGNVAARRRALETVVRSFEPALSPLIALALTDRDQTIRALAAAASARVVENLASARERLSARIALAAEGPDGTDAAQTLARLLADHARADVLLSDSQRIHLREDAVATIAAGTPHGGGTADARDRQTMLLETFWANGDYAAIDTMVAAIATLPADAATRDMARLAQWWRAGAAA
jgi:hypothetical protein